MKLRFLPLATSLLWAASFLYADPAPVAEVTKEAPPAQPAAPAEKPAEPAKPTENSAKAADLPPPKPLGDPVKNGLAWLAKAQNSDGGWGQGGGWRTNLQGEGGNGRVEGANVPDPSDLGNTAIALQAFLRAGTKLDTGEHSQVATKAAGFILAQLEADNEDSLFVTKVRDTQLQTKIGRYVDTFLAAQILSDLKGRFPNASDEERRTKLLDKVVAKIQQHQNEDGAFAGNSGWAATLSQGICSRALNTAYAAGAKVDLASLQKDHAQNATGLDRATGAVAGGVGAGAGDAGVEIYRYASKLGGMSSFSLNNASRRVELEKTAQAPASTPEQKQEAQKEIASIDEADKDQKILLQQVAGKAAEKGFVAGFGNNGGEEFISYMNIGEALRNKGGEEWTKWDESMTKTIHADQNADGSWAGQHCITGRTFCTASALMVLMTDRAPAAVVVKNEAEKAPAAK